MSDGPHRSLPMRRGWKKVAEYADKNAFTLNDLQEAVIVALGKDWRADIPIRLTRCICEVLGDPQKSLFLDQKIARLDLMRPAIAGHGFELVLLERAMEYAIKGLFGPDVPVMVARDALGIWASRCCRQVEEHYLRRSTLPRACNVRARMEEGMQEVSLDGLARELLDTNHGLVPRVVPKWSGLDEGVRL